MKDRIENEISFDGVQSEASNDFTEVGLLGAEEEYRLATLAVAGDAAAREKLILCNQRLVVMVAMRYVRACRELDLDDLKQAGNIGLIRAVDMFDPDKGFRFSTYAVWWIRQTITREIADRGRCVRLPVHISESVAKIKRAAAEIEQATGCSATPAQVAAKLGESEKRVNKLWEYIVTDPAVSIDKPVGEDGDATLGDMLATDETKSPDTQFDTSELRRQIDKALSALAPREIMIIKSRFGLDDGRPRTLEEVGDMYHVTRERVRQIEAKALRRLRSPRFAKYLKGFA